MIVSAEVESFGRLSSKIDNFFAFSSDGKPAMFSKMFISRTARIRLFWRASAYVFMLAKQWLSSGQMDAAKVR